MADLFDSPPPVQEGVGAFEPDHQARENPGDDPFAPLAMTEEERAALPPATRSKGYRQPQAQTADYYAATAAGDPEHGEGRRKRPRPVDHNARIKKFLEDKGFAATKMETWRRMRGGMQLKVDYMGLWDWEGIKAGEPRILLQGCTESNWQSHLRAMTDTKKAFDNKKPKIDNLRWSIDNAWCGLIIFKKEPNGRYTSRVLRITHGLVEEYLSRKRR